MILPVTNTVLCFQTHRHIDNESCIKMCPSFTCLFLEQICFKIWSSEINGGPVMDYFLIYNQDLIRSMPVNIVSHPGHMISRSAKSKATGLAVDILSFI